MLLAVSANHRVTSFDVLERLARIPDATAIVANAHPDIAGAVIVTTCNRFEAYLDLGIDSLHVDPEPAATAVLHELAEYSDIPFRQLEHAVQLSSGTQVARHLFAVTSGLESVAVGEEEIAGQVRRSLEDARRHGRTTASLESLFQRATETSKRVKQSTALNESGRSLVRLAVRLASSRVQDWSTARILLIGTGRYAAVTLATLRAVGAHTIAVSSASRNGPVFARSHGIELIPAEDFEARVAESDVVISCTTRDTFALDRNTLEARPQRAKLIVDLGLPRNVDPVVSGIPGVELLDLETIRLHAPIDEAEHIDAARTLVDESAREFVGIERTRHIAPGLTTVRAVLTDLRERERARHLGSDGAAPAELDRALEHFEAMLFHRFAQSAREAAGSGRDAEWREAIGLAFGVDV